MNFLLTKQKLLYNVFHLFWLEKEIIKTETITNNGRVFEFVGAGNGDYSALRKLLLRRNLKFFLQNANTLTKEKLAETSH